jgi:hypothetical protein
MPKKRKTEGAPITEQQFQQSLERIAAEIGRRRARQIADTAIKLTKLKIPRKAISICVNHIIELAWAELEEKPAPGTSTEQRIAELKEQLDYLNTLEDEGMRFRIQQEIQDLQDALKIENEWPELIGAESEGE